MPRNSRPTSRVMAFGSPSRSRKNFAAGRAFGSVPSADRISRTRASHGLLSAKEVRRYSCQAARRHVLVGPALHEHHVEDVGHVAGVFRAGEQAVDEAGTPIRGRILEEGAGLGRGGDGAREIEGDPAQEFGVGGGRGGVLVEVLLTGGDRPVDALVQRHRLGEAGSSEGGQEQGGEGESRHGAWSCAAGRRGGVGRHDVSGVGTVRGVKRISGMVQFRWNAGSARWRHVSNVPRIPGTLETCRHRRVTRL